MNSNRRTLLIGYGNPGRRDDGLGPALAQALEARAIPGLTVASDYQLMVEDAAEAARHDVVIFADADRCGPAPFRLRRLQPGPAQFSFSTHSVGPAGVLALTRDLFQAQPEGWLLGIRGHEFDDFGEGLSEAARSHLAEALSALEAALTTGTLREIQPAEELALPGPAAAAGECER